MMARAFGPVGIIDIGSNTIRLVVFAGSERVPSVIFNEKVTAGLGRGVASNGKIDAESWDLALSSLSRFVRVAKAIGTRRLLTVATAAVRDASNGATFLKDVSALGLRPRLLSGEEEAELAGMGALSGFPRANGIVADLGGGSLELVGVARSLVGDGISLPLGVQRIDGMTRSTLQKRITDSIPSRQFARAARGQSLYLVGGSFRALTQLDLGLLDHPLPMIHNHRLDTSRFAELRKAIETLSVDGLRALGVSSARIPMLGGALSILEGLVEVFEPRRVHASSFGLREGLLYRDLPDDVRRQDPLLAAALEAAKRLGRFDDHGAVLDAWIAPLFPDDDGDSQRYRLCACLLGDIAWNAHPDFRSQRAVDLAIHSNWVAIDAHGRSLVGRTLHAAFGGNNGFDLRLEALLRPGEVERAEAWGKAIRLAQRLSAGTDTLLARTSIALRGGKVVLTIPAKARDLFAQPVDRRLNALAKCLGREPELVLA